MSPSTTLCLPRSRRSRSRPNPPSHGVSERSTCSFQSFKGPMKRSDLINLDGERWIVGQELNGTTILVSPTGQLKTDIPASLDQTDPERCQVICCPTADWPFVILQDRFGWGKLTEVGRPQRGSLGILKAFHDWVVGEPLRRGGALYLNPSLNLRPQDRLTLKFEKAQTTLKIPMSFATFGVRKSRASEPPKDNRPSIYDKLLSGDDD